MKEIIFLHPYINNERCHAKVVDKLSVDPKRNYIGTIDGYEIYKTYGSLYRRDYDSFKFEAIKEER